MSGQEDTGELYIVDTRYWPGPDVRLDHDAVLQPPVLLLPPEDRPHLPPLPHWGVWELPGEDQVCLAQLEGGEQPRQDWEDDHADCLTVWLSDINILSSLPSLHITAHQRPASALFYIHRQTDQERIKSVCLYFNKITQLFYHQRRLRSSWSHQSAGCQMWRKMIWKYSVDWLSFIKSRSGGILMR